jgi:hypothetical protein
VSYKALAVIAVNFYLILIRIKAAAARHKAQVAASLRLDPQSLSRYSEAKSRSTGCGFYLYKPI